MGIKFHCPSGHKLNVKAFLAGKKAVCPKCGEKVLVPHESDPAFASGTQSSREEQPSVLPPQPEKPLPPTLAAISPPPRPAAPAETPATDVGAWYVRPPSGGQYGPAEPDVMNGWVADGRVPATSLVWRAGWPEWRIAHDVFPQLASVPSAATIVLPAQEVRNPVTPPQTPLASVAPLVTPLGTAGGPGVPRAQPDLGALIGISTDTPTLKTTTPGVRRRRNDNTIIVSGILAVLVFVLFVILGVVLWRQGAEPSPTAEPKGKSSPVASEESDEESLDSQPSAVPAPGAAENPEEPSVP